MCGNEVRAGRKWGNKEVYAGADEGTLYTDKRANVSTKLYDEDVSLQKSRMETKENERAFVCLVPNIRPIVT